MMSVLISVQAALRGLIQPRVALHLEVLALRHQLQVLQRSQPRQLRLTRADRWLWAWLSRAWGDWRTAVVIVKPETVVAWHRQGFRLFWTGKSRRRHGRPPVAADARALIRTTSEHNPLWGAPRIHGELARLGIDVSQATVAKYMARRRRPPSQTWRTFLTNHVHQIVAADFFVVPTATFRLLFVLVILAHDRRRVMHTAVTAHPTAVWTAQQFREAFPWDQAPAYLIHDRDRAFQAVKATVDAMGIEEVLTAPRSPWQNAYAERFIGSVRRECLDHVIVLNAAGLRQILKSYVGYYSTSRTHLAREGLARTTAGDATESRPSDRHSPSGRTPSPVRSSRCVDVSLGSVRRVRPVSAGTRRERPRRQTSDEGHEPRPDREPFDRRNRAWRPTAPRVGTAR